MTSSDDAHWAVINPSFGIMLKWDLDASVTSRMAPKTQIAGAVVVVDCIVVLKMMLDEGIAPMVVHLQQLVALKSTYDQVAKEGTRCATSFLAISG
ncbi:unnamed protein product, partial [Didymodactylos carnosus]